MKDLVPVVNSFFVSFPCGGQVQLSNRTAPIAQVGQMMRNELRFLGDIEPPVAVYIAVHTRRIETIKVKDWKLKNLKQKTFTMQNY